EATRTAADLRGSGVPVLHLAEDLPPAQAAEYARSVDAGWVCYPAPDGVKLAAADGGEPEIVSLEECAGRVLS
nr:hypothetical protein [Actinomycetota bacterium]